MKLVTNLSDEQRSRIDDIIKLHEKMRNCYFFSPPPFSNMRTRYSEDNSDEYKTDVDGIKINLYCCTSCSCRNVYYSGRFYIGGKKVTIREVKKLVNLSENEKININRFNTIKEFIK